MEKVVIVSGTRSPIGKYNGTLKNFSAAELGTKIAAAAIEQAKISVEALQQSIIGNAFENEENIARQIANNIGIPASHLATTINEGILSGLKAVILGAQQIQLGNAEVILVGGSENASRFLPQMKEPLEKNIEINSLSHDEIKQHVLDSQKKATIARDNLKFTREITPIPLADGGFFSQDEGIQNHAVEQSVAPLSDGAAMLILASESYAKNHNLDYLASIENYSEVENDSMVSASVKAMQALIENQNVALKDIDLFELDDTFAETFLAIQKKLQLPAEKINIYGGNLALGNPVGASGARMLVTLLSELHQENQETGILSLSNQDGQGLALLVKKIAGPNEPPKNKKFYQLTRKERLEKLVSDHLITQEEATFLEEKQLLDQDVANNMIENQIGEVELPMGIAQNFLINGKTYAIPMATEEPSVIAAASNAAKIINKSGGFVTTTGERLMRGQIVFQNVADTAALAAALTEKKAELLSLAKEIYPSIVKRGGGLKKIELRQLENFLSLDALVDTQDAMGANIINTILEGLAQQIRLWFPEKEILFSILSNFPTEALSHASCRIPVEFLATKNLPGLLVAEKISVASQFAKLDPYRAATHNKGIMNGIDAVVLATGNDTRAVAAGIHAYASRNGTYQGLTDWQVIDDMLVGQLSLPIAVGTVGGATKVLPKAKIAMTMLHSPNAQQLAEIITAVGLGQNLAAVRALVTDGIQKGHMNLHMRQLAISAGAKGIEIEKLTKQLQSSTTRNLALAQQLLTELRT